MLRLILGDTEGEKDPAASEGDKLADSEGLRDGDNDWLILGLTDGDKLTEMLGEAEADRETLNDGLREGL